MYFWCICGEDGDLHILFLCHLEGLPLYFFTSTHNWPLSLYYWQTKFRNSWLWTYLYTTYRHVKYFVMYACHSLRNSSLFLTRSLGFPGKPRNLEKGIYKRVLDKALAIYIYICIYIYIYIYICIYIYIYMVINSNKRRELTNNRTIHFCNS